jgi:hypothetical protein
MQLQILSAWLLMQPLAHSLCFAFPSKPPVQRLQTISQNRIEYVLRARDLQSVRVQPIAATVPFVAVCTHWRNISGVSQTELSAHV